jgi:hypothetical protein
MGGEVPAIGGNKRAMSQHCTKELQISPERRWHTVTNCSGQAPDPGIWWIDIHCPRGGQYHLLRIDGNCITFLA